MTYLFTTKDLKVLEVCNFVSEDAEENTSGKKALKYRRKLGKDVLAWCSMGGENPIQELKIKPKNK